MKVNFVRPKRTFSAVLLILLLSMSGMTKAQTGNITFADADVKAICVANWDTNGDGELSYAEADAVTSLNGMFMFDDEITTFDELWFFTGLTSIGEDEFNSCTGLTSISIPNTITSIGNYAFSDCTGLTSITLYACTPPTLGNSVFDNVPSAMVVNVPCHTSALYQTANEWSNISNYQEFSYSLCPIIFADANVKAICVAHWDTDNDGELNYAEAAAVNNLGTYFKSSAITSFDELEYFTSLTSIPNTAFYGCTSLAAIALPSSLSTLGNGSFYNCTSLSTLTVYAETPPTVGTNAFKNVPIDMVVHVPCGTNNSYHNANGWSGFANIQEFGPCPIVFADANVKAICVSNWDTNGDGDLSYAEAEAVTDLGMVFRNNSNIISFDELQYFRGLTSICSEAFYNCNALTSITIPNTVISLGSDSFSNCIGLASITIPNSVITIGNFAFYQCTGLTSVNIPNSVKSIESYAFNNCTSLTSITIPNSVITIGSNVFCNCIGLTSITIPNSVISIGTYAFSSCSGLEQIIVESGNTVYDSRNNCNAIIKTNTNELISGCKNTIIPNSVTSIGNLAFNSCTGLTSITIPNSVTSIGNSAFSSCSNLNSVSIGNSVASIGTYAFSGCSHIASLVVWPDNPPTLSNYAFRDVNRSIPLYVSCGSSEAYQNALGWYEFTNCIEMCPGVITVTANSAGFGTVAGGGSFEGGETCTVTATPNEGYFFSYWSENDQGVYTEPSYSFIVTGDRSLVANFVLDGIIVFADESVKALCVANWDTNGDGELSYFEANAVTDLGTVFYYQRYITSFDELQYFTGLTSISSEAFYNCYALTSITIPNTVTSIGAYAFNNCYALTSIIIPNPLLSLGSYAFYNCNTLTSIDIGDALTSIPGYTFAYCSSLTSITIPNTVVSIGSAAFKECSSLASITIPSSVTSIGGDTFRNCSGLGQIIVESGNTVYDSRNGCNALIKTSTNALLVGCKNTVIPNTVTSIDNQAFYQCTGLTSITIPNSVTSIGNNAFSGCSGLNSVSIGNSVASIGNSVFRSCSALEQIIVDSENTVFDSRDNCNAIIKTSTNELISGCKNTIIPNTVTSVGDYAFYECIGLTSLTIPNSVTSIGADAFYRCSGMTSLNIGNSVTSIGTYAFYYCNGLTSIMVWPENPPTLGNYVFGAVNRTTPLYVSCGFSAAYQNATGWNEFTNCLEMCSGVITVAANPIEFGTVAGSGSFEGGETCTVTATPNEGCFFSYWSENGQGVCNEPSYSFIVTGDRALVANFASDGIIAFADNNVKAICVANWDTNGDGELSYSEANAVTDLGMTFRNKSNIITFDELQYFTGLTSIASFAFSSCSNMTSITMPSTITSIQMDAFSYCSSLTSIDIPDNVTSIENDVFYRCRGLTSITIPNSVISLGNHVFYLCTGLTSVNIGNSVVSLGNYVFQQCTSLTSIILPNSVNSIGKEAFRDCIGLTTMTIPDAVTSIGTGVFYGCSSLEQIVVDGENTVYDSRDNCNAIINTETNKLIAGCQNTVIPNSVTSIGEYAFAGCTGLISIDISNSVTSIGNYAFYLCSGLTSVSIGNSLTSIGSSAFASCSALGEITVASDNGVYDSRDNCNAIIKTSTNELVVGCKNTIIPESVISIGAYAFNGCTSLTSIDIPNSVTSIENMAFYGCSGLTSLDIGNSVTSISTYAFYGCNSLTSVSIPNSVTSIGNYAFNACSHLTSVSIGNSVTSIGNYAFSGCSYIASIMVWAENPPALGSSAFANVSRSIPLFVPCGFSEAYQSAEGWNEFTNCLGMCQSMITVVANPAGYGTVTGGGAYQGGETCTVTATPNEGYYFTYWTDNGQPVISETSYSFIVAGDRTLVANFALDGIIAFADDNVKALCVANWDTNGDGELSYAEADAVTDLGTVFKNKVNITSFDELQYFTGLTIIQNDAFYLCYGLSSVVIPNTVTTIGSRAFSYCDLISITIPNTVTSIGSSAFSYCTGLTSITIPSSVTSIGTNPFQACDNLEQVIVETGNTMYDSRNNCNAIIATSTNALISGCKTTVIPNSVTSIENYSFAYYSGLTSISIPSSVTSIGDYAIRGCVNLEQIVVDPDNTEYDSRDNCNALIKTSTNALITGCMTTIIPNSVTSIGAYAFYNCTGLTSIIIPNSVTSIGSDAFYLCTNLTSVSIGSSVTSIGSVAFFYCEALTSMTVWAENPPVLGGSAFGVVSKSIPVYVPCGSLEAYQNATGWSQFTNIQEICSQSQTFQLVQGWNWCSFNVDITLDDLKAALVEALPGTAIKIKGKDNNTAYNPNTQRWLGTLTWDLSQMYEIQIDADCEITLEGLPSNPAEQPVTIVNGANWIAFPLGESMSLTDVFTGFAVNGDVIKSKDGTATYIRGRWQGQSLTALEPGQGYIYISSEEGDRILVFPTNAK